MKLFKQFLLLGFCFILFGCQKKPFDYRNKFLGDYTFVTHVHSVYGISPVIIHDTTYTNDGKIWYGSDENKVSISFSGGGTSEFTIYEDGTLEGNGCSGEFESTTKVKYHCGYYSPGGSTTNTITGTKK
ncbi:MAG TPA: hypothetical protein VNG53_06330 [Bacteroidia bacterium]|nr:hypothetical protein [Bacteroidia bacterium]